MSLFVPVIPPEEDAAREYWQQVDGSYAAISHVWGDVKSVSDPRNTRNNGSTLIRSAAKLECLWNIVNRFTDAEGKKVWCDVLCIGQDNPVDKCIQVSVMDRIYQHASVCWVVLSADDAKAFRTLARYLAKFGNRSEIDWSKCSCKASVASDLELPWCGSIVCRSLRSIESEYFSRAWTLQECILSRDLLFVDERLAPILTAKHLKEAFFALEEQIRLAEENEAVDGVLISEAMEVISLLEVCKYLCLGTKGLAALPNPTRIEMLLNYGHRECSVQHDIIYSRFKLLGVSVPVDYSMKVSDLVRKFLYELIMEGYVYLEPCRESFMSFDSIPGSNWLGALFEEKSHGPYSIKQFSKFDIKSNVHPLPRDKIILEQDGTLRFLDFPSIRVWLVNIDDQNEIVELEASEEQPGPIPEGETNYSIKLKWGEQVWNTSAPRGRCNGQMHLLILSEDQMLVADFEASELIVTIRLDDVDDLGDEDLEEPDNSDDGDDNEEVEDSDAKNPNDPVDLVNSGEGGCDDEENDEDPGGEWEVNFVAELSQLTSRVLSLSLK
ncbi:hypothetical protein HDU83_001752 [Entophlyctis luteolus]|nr:hypothetical protein HDU82_000771 [Entophlyctis luteolus]KAJ3356173.1 hypothetical protein HDU83_001752 [Entophlyctis luteolus]KAJ3394100.1 hypothetical protein HDU84_000128 [Entophlyctis sp. JEL0112]